MEVYHCESLDHSRLSEFTSVRWTSETSMPVPLSLMLTTTYLFLSLSFTCSWIEIESVIHEYLIDTYEDDCRRSSYGYIDIKSLQSEMT
jgi:hypothetical protein